MLAWPLPLSRYDQYADGWDTAVSLTIDGEQVRFFHTLQKGVHRVFVDHPWFLAKVGDGRRVLMKQSSFRSKQMLIRVGRCFSGLA